MKLRKQALDLIFTQQEKASIKAPLDITTQKISLLVTTKKFDKILTAAKAKGWLRYI